jgi:hypothetical protein
MANEIYSSVKRDHANSESILKLEKMIGSKVPLNLREYLIKYKTVVFKHKKFIRIVDKNFHQEMALEKIVSIEDIITGMKNLDDDEFIKAGDLLIFGETLGSPILCIGIKNENYNQIFVLDWDFGLTKVSDSFSDFINSLE